MSDTEQSNDFEVDLVKRVRQLRGERDELVREIGRMGFDELVWTDMYGAAQRRLDTLFRQLPVGQLPSIWHLRRRRAWLRQRDSFMAAGFTLGTGAALTSGEVVSE